MRGLYTDVERWFELLPKYLFLEPFLEGKRVLEVDCGTGWGTAMISRSAREVIALCASEEDAARAKEAEPALRRSFQRIIPKDLPFVDGTFDAVLAFRGAEAFGGLEALADEARRVLRPSGIFCIGAPNPGKRALPEILQDQPAQTGSLGFYELQRRLRGRFAQVRMIAQSPFFGVSFIDYSPDDSDAFSMDSSLLPDGSEDATSFLAFCGKVRLPAVDFSLIQLPLEELYSLSTKRPLSVVADKASQEELTHLRSQRSALLRAKATWEAKAHEAARRLNRLSSLPKKDPAVEQQALEQKKILEEAQKKEAELEKTLQEAKEREEKLQADRLRMERNVVEYLGKINEQRNSIKDLEERREELTAKLVRQTNYQQDLKKQITEGRFTEKNLQTSAEKLENELKDSEKKLQKTEEERKARETELAERAEKAEKSRAELASLLDDARRSLSKKEEELSEETKRAKNLDAKAKRAEYDANEAREQLAGLTKERRVLEERAVSAEAQHLHLKRDEDEKRSQIYNAQSLLAEKDYLLAEATARRIESEWRAEELSQEVALRRSLQAGTLLGSLESRAEELSQSAERATRIAQEAESQSHKWREELSSAKAAREAAQAELASLQQRMQELEGSLQDAERRSAASRERALAAARDATSARSRQSKLETEIAEMQASYKRLEGKDPTAPPAPKVPGPTRKEKSLQLVVRRQAELLRRAAMERRALHRRREEPKKLPPEPEPLDEFEEESTIEQENELLLIERKAALEEEAAKLLAARRAQLEEEANQELQSRKNMLQEIASQSLAGRRAELEAEAARELVSRRAELEELFQNNFSIKRSELEASLEQAFFAKQAQLETELAQTLAKERATLEAEAERAFLVQKQSAPKPSEGEINALVNQRLAQIAPPSDASQSKLAQELAATKASLEACRLARAEADRKTKLALERAIKAEEELAKRR